MSFFKCDDKNCYPLDEFLNEDNSFFGLTLLPSLAKGLTAGGRFQYPAIDISEDDNNIVIKADLPGFKREKINVSVQDDLLVIQGERSAESEAKSRNFYRTERSYGRFERSIALGNSVDKEKVKANYKDGVLEIILPKSEKVKPKQVQVDLE